MVIHDDKNSLVEHQSLVSHFQSISVRLTKILTFSNDLTLQTIKFLFSLKCHLLFDIKVTKTQTFGTQCRAVKMKKIRFLDKKLKKKITNKLQQRFLIKFLRYLCVLALNFCFK